jgi:hypothetical protein
VLAEQLRIEWDSAVRTLTRLDNGEPEPLEAAEPPDTGTDDVTVVEFTKTYAKKCNSLLSYV